MVRQHGWPSGGSGVPSIEPAAMARGALGSAGWLNSRGKAANCAAFSLILKETFDNGPFYQLARQGKGATTMLIRGLRNLHKFVSVKDKPNLEYWVSQAIIIISTVLGVYLAALAGYEISVKFDNYKTVRERANVEGALLAELQDNVARVDRWHKRYEEGYSATWHSSEYSPRKRHQLDTFVWNAMQESPATFEIDDEILTESRRFYSTVQSKMGVMFSNNRESSVTNDAMKAMKTAADKVRERTIPKLKAAIKKWEERVAELKP
jgi:hypothetical protein